MPHLIGVIKGTLMIAGFAFVMMVVVEYLNVVTGGAWQKVLCGKRWKQYLVATTIGAIPGCLGAFTNVALYTHRIVSFGALVGGMVATSGDEAFVMLAMFPLKALLLIGVLLVMGLVIGATTDKIMGVDFARAAERCERLELHVEHVHDYFRPAQIAVQLRKCSLPRGVLLVGLAVFIFALVTGEISVEEQAWLRITSVIVSVVGLFIAATVPDHFLEEHLWNHVARVHLPRLFLWTFGALLLIAVAQHYLHIESWIRYSPLAVMVIACLVGIIPESGPNLVFVTLFAQGLIPFSVLLANSIVQDGHGMLPLLAHSRRDFVKVKTINFSVGLATGLVGYLMRF